MGQKSMTLGKNFLTGEPLNPEALRYIRYLNFKMSCVEEQERLGWRLDMDRAMKNYDLLSKLQKEKVEQLREAMPKVPKYTTYTIPKIMYRKDGTLSANGEKWFARLKEHGYKPTEKGPISVVTDWELPNPKSTVQVKDWLNSLGWKPQTFDYKKDKNTGEERQIPQVRDDGELCPSVKKLINKDPAIELLDGLTVINHRLAIFKGFIESAVRKDDGTYWLKAGMQGLTNTLRLRHRKPLVNLPGVDAKYGDEVRGCLIAPEGQWLVGSDMVSLEATTRNHYIKPLDPVYVDEMSQEGYDPHLKIAVVADMITDDEYEFYKWYHMTKQ
jgi:hypothetical protein